MYHVKNQVRNHYMNSINWQIVPKGHDNTKLNTSVIACLNKKYRHLTTEESRLEVQKVLTLLKSTNTK